MASPQNGNVAIPRWFLRFCSAFMGVMLLIGGAAVPWAWKMSMDMGVVKIQVREVIGVRFQLIEKRLDRIEDAAR